MWLGKSSIWSRVPGGGRNFCNLFWANSPVHFYCALACFHGPHSQRASLFFSTFISPNTFPHILSLLLEPISSSLTNYKNKEYPHIQSQLKLLLTFGFFYLIILFYLYFFSWIIWRLHLVCLFFKFIYLSMFDLTCMSVDGVGST